MSEHVEVGNVCVGCDELWPCRAWLIAEVAGLAMERDAGLVMLAEQQEAARTLMWMAEKYAEGGGSNGPEMRDYREAEEVLNAVPDQRGREIMAAGNAMADTCRTHAAAWGALVDGNALRAAFTRWQAAVGVDLRGDDE